MWVGVSLHALICISLLCFSYTETVKQTVPLNMQSSVYNDIALLEHDESQLQFHLQLKPERRCASPTFLLRLSGTALCKLELTSQQDGLYSYHYPQLKDPGEYFLDAIVLFCDTYDPNNQTTICMVDASYRKNVISGPYSFTVQPATTPANTTPVPRWRNTAAPTFLPTRYQKLIAEPLGGLTCNQHFADIYCAPEVQELVPYKAYHWVDQPAWQPRARQVLQQRVILDKPTDAAISSSAQSAYQVNICFVGDSHSRELTWHAWDYVDAMSVVTFTYIMSLFPPLFSTDQLDQHKCSIAVVSYGQWSLGYHAVSPRTENAYRAEMQGVMQKFSAYQGPARIFFRSENYNGMGDFIRACPHIDYRFPPAIDSLNKVIREVTAACGAPFIDLHAVIGPMWDAALDYSHPIHHVLRAEVDVILHAVFSDVIRRNGTIRSFALGARSYEKETNGQMFVDQINAMKAVAAANAASAAAPAG